MEKTLEIILSTRNLSKVEQIKAIFAGLNMQVASLADLNIKGDVIEDGNTLEENALKKAIFAHKETGKWCLADDTGLWIDALSGAPGIHAARWAGENKSTDEIRNFTLEKLKDVPWYKRDAIFKTVAVVVSPVGEHVFFDGRVSGKILTYPRTKSQPNMPYSGIFVPNGSHKVWAEMSVSEENVISHRGKAFRLVRDFLAEVSK